MEGNNNPESPRGEKRGRTHQGQEQGDRRQKIRRSAEESIENNEELIRLSEQLATEEERERKEVISGIVNKIDDEIARIEVQASDRPPQTEGAGGGNEPPEKPPTVEVSPEPEEPGGENKDELTEEGKNLARAIREGRVRPEWMKKNEKLRRIMLENGISQEDFDSKKTEELAEMFQEAESQRNEPPTGGGGDRQPPNEPPAPPASPEPEEPAEFSPEMLELLNKASEGADIFESMKSFVDSASDEDLIKAISNSDTFFRALVDSSELRLSPQKDEIINAYIQRVKQLIDESAANTREAYKALLDKLNNDAQKAMVEGVTLQEQVDEQPVGVLNQYTEEQIKEATQAAEGAIISGRDLRNMYATAYHIGTDEDLNNLIRGLLLNDETLGSLLRRAFGSVELGQKYRQFRDAVNTQDPVEMRTKVLNFIKEMDENIGGKEEADEDINSIQDLFRYIALSQDKELWGSEGLYPLLSVNEKGEEIIHPENFLIWLRDAAVKKHKDNANDQMSPLAAVGIETRLGLKSIYTMTREAPEKYFKDEKTGIVDRELVNRVMTDAWFFGVLRNEDLIYRQIMHDDGKLPEQVAAIHARNDLTRDDTFAATLSLPEKYGSEDTKVGDSIMFMNDIYYNIGDVNELKKFLGEELFTQEDFINAIRILQGKKDWEDIDSYEGHYDENEKRLFVLQEDGDTGVKTPKYLFDKDGKLDPAAWKLLNFYTSPTFPLSTIALVREVIRVRTGRRFGLSDGIAYTAEERNVKQVDYEKNVREKGLVEADRLFKLARTSARINLEYAEVLSNSSQRPFGIGAKNDEAYRAHDAGTKTKIEPYVLRQSGERTAGPIGIPDAIGILKDVAPDFWIGLKTESGKSPYELFVEWRNLMNDAAVSEEEKVEKRKEIMNQLRFRDVAEQDYASNEQIRGFQLFHNQTGGEGLGLNEIVTYNYLTGVKYDVSKFEKKIKDDFIKVLRYAFSSNAGLHYAQKLRYYDARTGEYVDGRLADRMFGGEVLSDIREQVARLDKQKKGLIKLEEKESDPAKKEALKKERESWESLVNNRQIDNPDQLYDVAYDYMDTSAGRIRLVKNIARARIAAELRFHRRSKSVGEPWGFFRTQTFIKALETIKAYERDPDYPGRVREVADQPFFSPEDIEWIRKHSKTEYWRLFLQDAAKGGGIGFGKGLLDALKVFMGGFK